MTTSPRPAPGVRVDDAHHLARWGLGVVLPILILMIVGTLLARTEREIALVVAGGAAALAVVLVLGFVRGAPVSRG